MYLQNLFFKQKKYLQLKGPTILKGILVNKKNASHEF